MLFAGWEVRIVKICYRGLEKSEVKTNSILKNKLYFS